MKIAFFLLLSVILCSAKIAITSPRKGAAASSCPKLVWFDKSASRQQTYDVKVYHENGTLLIEDNTMLSSYQITGNGDLLGKGTYRWTVSSGSSNMDEATFIVPDESLCVPEGAILNPLDGGFLVYPLFNSSVEGEEGSFNWNITNESTLDCVGCTSYPNVLLPHSGDRMFKATLTSTSTPFTLTMGGAWTRNSKYIAFSFAGLNGGKSQLEVYINTGVEGETDKKIYETSFTYETEGISNGKFVEVYKDISEYSKTVPEDGSWGYTKFVVKNGDVPKIRSPREYMFFLNDVIIGSCTTFNHISYPYPSLAFGDDNCTYCERSDAFLSSDFTCGSCSSFTDKDSCTAAQGCVFSTKDNKCDSEEKYKNTCDGLSETDCGSAGVCSFCRTTGKCLLKTTFDLNCPMCAAYTDANTCPGSCTSCEDKKTCDEPKEDGCPACRCCISNPTLFACVTCDTENKKCSSCPLGQKLGSDGSCTSCGNDECCPFGGLKPVSHNCSTCTESQTTCSKCNEGLVLNGTECLPKPSTATVTVFSALALLIAALAIF